MGQSYGTIKDQKLGAVLAPNQDFAKREGLEPKDEKFSENV